ncbi:hypothetical protein SAMN04487970_105111 [Paenibacillus tianmuensis]|uniref:CdiI immunity protein domain-containing protein n=1 Tax=Paenibacillus tianmuensis TaxID=624147 RepID=A0A1G4TFX3_9BACL|nr:hypothetical protein [Paenibacillus tianmuensis]SCW80226.1 hypothetical protein SAMN04487970_105111 [Paenibacillus tianmuensis]
MSEDNFVTFEHYMAMYSVNNNLPPSLERLVEHFELYRTMESNEIVHELIKQIVLFKNHEFTSELVEILEMYGNGISLEQFRVLIDPLINAISK